MPLTQKIRIKGGQCPASEFQKTVARETILKTQPWKKSTGAKSKRGKGVSSQNASKGGKGKFHFRRLVKSWEVENFAAECLWLDQMIDQIAAECQALKDCSNPPTVRIKAAPTIRRTHHADEHGNRWAVYSVQCKFELKIDIKWSYRAGSSSPMPNIQDFDAFSSQVTDCYLATQSRVANLIAQMKERSVVSCT